MGKLVCTLIFFVVTLESVAKITPSKIRNTLKSHNARVLSLQKEIVHMERQLGKTNKRYLGILKTRKAIDEAIYAQKKGLGKNSSDIEKKIQRVSHMVKLTVVNSMGDQGNDPGGILYKKIVLKTLKKELDELKLYKDDNEKLVLKLSLLESRYRENLETEKQLSSLMQSWEYEKREKIDSYMAHSKKADRLKKRYGKLTKKKRVVALSESFRSPLDSYASVQHDKKGVTYKVKGRRKVKSTRHGKVVYSGKLSTYGNVVMLDHGNELRSIILGKFTPGVSKGSVVKLGEILGHTHKNGGKIYFEVRKKNKAQNTMRLIDKRIRKI